MIYTKLYVLSYSDDWLWLNVMKRQKPSGTQGRKKRKEEEEKREKDRGDEWWRKCDDCDHEIFLNKICSAVTGYFT